MAAFPRRRNRKRALENWLTTTGAVSLLVGAPAWAERVDVEPSASARFTASDNAGLGTSTPGRDFISDVTAGLRVRAEGAQLSLVGTVSVEGIDYARHTQANEFIPNVDLTGRWAAVERFLFVEAAARTTQTNINPYGPTLTSTTTANNTTITQYRLSPYIESQPSSNLHFRARSDNVQTKDYGLASASINAIDAAFFSFNTISLERDPVPFGWRFEGQSSYTRYQGEFLPVETDIVRAIVNVAATDTARVGLRFGYERDNFLSDQGWQPIYGGQASWRPSDRTFFDFEAERRFFGNGMHLLFTHRMPWLSWDFRASRDLDTTPSSIFTLPATNNVSALLDSILITRFPNPVDRATQVQNIISRQGLPPATSIATAILGPRLSVTENASLGLTYLGVRHTLALTAFATKTQDALDTGQFATNSAATNNLQYGSTLAYTLRLTPTATAGVGVTFSRIQSLDTATTPGSTKDGAVSGQVVFQLAPKTTALVGASQRKLVSDVVPGGHETSAFVLLDHRF
jgi:uncharacterized protein (PEP-CTERM system associated)